MSDRKVIRIPCAGFGDSMHGQRVIDEFDEFMSDGHGDVYRDLVERSEDVLDWDEVHRQYAEKYCESFWYDHARGILPSMRYAELKFGTVARDVIYASASNDDIEQLYDSTDRETVERVIGEYHRARDAINERRLSGPVPLSYGADFSEWPESVTDWTPGQLEVLLVAKLLENGVGAYEFSEWEMDFCDETAIDHMLGWWLNAVRDGDGWSALITERDARRDAKDAAAANTP